MKNIALFVLIISALSLDIYAENPRGIDGIFGGRVSKVNPEAGLIRVRIDFTNMKYLNKKDQVEFFAETHSKIRCTAYIAGKTNRYMLLKAPNFNKCQASVHVAPGKYLMFFSQDLKNNLAMGEELMRVLLKKRLALDGQKGRTKRELDAYIEKSNSVNERYGLLREKLEAEWRDQLSRLEEDRTVELRNLKSLEQRLNDIDMKLEQYKIEDYNLKQDRWALDPRLYYRK